jgi:sec-independent protein translocase protein TatA
LFSGNELIIIIIVALLIFGVKKAPQIGNSLGKSIKSFKQAAKGIDEIDVTPVDVVDIVEEETKQENGPDKGSAL